MALLPCGENAREAGENQEAGVILLRARRGFFLPLPAAPPFAAIALRPSSVS